MHMQLTYYLESNTLMATTQYGYRSNIYHNILGILIYSYKKIIKTIYSSLIESHINYCLVLWGTNYDRIFKLKKKAVRIISFAHYKSHTSPLFKSLGILNIKDMYNMGFLLN